ncbi:hypothetical protein KUCAC02_025782, partial [Chaenocephalus aceratus]
FRPWLYKRYAPEVCRTAEVASGQFGLTDWDSAAASYQPAITLSAHWSCFIYLPHLTPPCCVACEL